MRLARRHSSSCPSALVAIAFLLAFALAPSCSSAHALSRSAAQHARDGDPASVVMLSGYSEVAPFRPMPRPLRSTVHEMDNVQASGGDVVLVRRQSSAPLNQPGSGNALGPTPSTSVALIILYSITGVITALFLLIIITGAIRAHRHPERYGPRATARFGQPRQSRAKGIARAVLDTIPIVRFGGARDDQAIVKPTDVEMQSNVASQPRLSAEATSSRTGPPADSDEAVPPATGNSNAGEKPGEKQEEHADVSQLRCPVCIDDFEEGQEMRVLPCQHNFHPDCIDPWLLNVSGSCPLCRTDLHGDQEWPSQDGDGQQPSEELPPQRRPTERHTHGSRLSRYLDVARGTSGEERMAALRQLREESRSGNQNSEHRLSVVGLGRLKRVFGKRDGTDSPPQESQGDRHGEPGPSAA